LETGDLEDTARLAEVFAKYRPAAVMHFAAYAYVGESVRDPLKYYRNNFGGTLNLLQAMREQGVDQLVFSSTCATYGIPQAETLDEIHPQQPVNPYGTSKLMIEQVLRDFDTAYGMRHVALRYFNAAGADPDGEIGEVHEPETHLIPLVLEAAAGGEPVTVFGDDYPTPDGTCIRDYIHVADLADAHVLALEALQQGARSSAYNLGNGNGYSVQEVIDCAQRVTGRDVDARIGPRRPGDPPRLVAESTRARRELKWQPGFAGLEQMVKSAWDWNQAGLVQRSGG
jgi:UDP-arabinose 4-epimerase